ncbi:MAG: hypothetical protein HQK67_10335, partial [Desulfamplus sp.]|nr:hypothetical protein [Desulfamplus sp.]
SPFNSQFNSPFGSPFQTLFQSPFHAIFQQAEGKSHEQPFKWPFQSGDGSGQDGKKNDDGSGETTGQRKDILTAIANAMKNWQTMAGIMSSPESMAALLKGMGTMPEMLNNFIQSTMASMAEIHQKMAASVSRIGETVHAYKFDNLDENIFHAWSDIYEKEFRKFLQVPQLGLTREYQEKVNNLADKFNICQTHMADFLRLLSLPFQRSAIVMQEEIQKLAEKEQLSEDPQFYYQMWVKILEGHFMTLFQTPEYIEALTKTVGSMSKYTSSKESVIEDLLRSLPVASRSELDDVSKEIHQLKKEIRNLKKKIS